MPDAPERSDQDHAAGLREKRKQNGQAQAGILNPHFHGDGTSILPGQTREHAGKGPHAQRQHILQHHQNDDAIRRGQEHIHVVAERHPNKQQQYQQRQ